MASIFPTNRVAVTVEKSPIDNSDRKIAKDVSGELEIASSAEVAPGNTIEIHASDAALLKTYGIVKDV